MATASVFNGSENISDAVRREKAATRFLDHFIDSQYSKHQPDRQVSLSDLNEYLRKHSPDREMKDYIGTSCDKIGSFLMHRPYLWALEAASKYRTDASKVLLRKRSSKTRYLCVDIVEYLQERNMRNDFTAGRMALQRRFGVSADMLLDYPTLFVLDTYSHHDTFINRAWVVDSVILLPEVCKFTHPIYLEGIGTVTKFLGSAGFLRDDISDGSIYFKRCDVHRDLPTGHRIRVGQRYFFQSVINPMYEKGETENKWAAVSIKPAQVRHSKSDADSAWAAGKMAPSRGETSSYTPRADTAQRRFDELSDFFDSPPCWDHELPVVYDPWLATMRTRLNKLRTDIL